jgi:hypothetical protein
MNDDKLLEIIYKNNVNDKDAVGMIFSNYIDIGGNLIGLKVESAIKAGELLRRYDKQKSTQLETENAELKSQHERDEKEKRVLADRLAFVYVHKDYKGQIANTYYELAQPEYWLDYAKKEEGK